MPNIKPLKTLTLPDAQGQQIKYELYPHWDNIEGKPKSFGGPVVVQDTILSFDNAALAPFHNIAAYGKTTQNGAPTLTAPVDLVNASDGGSINVSICGKNLSNVSELTILVGKRTAVIEPLSTLVSGKTYTISADVETTSSVADGEKCLVYDNSNGKILGYLTKGEGSSATFTIGAKNCTSLILYASNNYAGSEDDEASFGNIQIELGSSFTGYEPYIEPQTLTVSTPNGLYGIPVTANGNYTDENGQQWICDEINLANCTYTKRIQKIVLDGSVAFSGITNGSKTLYTGKVFDAIGTNVGYCSHLKYDKTKAYNGNAGYIGVDGQRLYVTTTMTVTEFNALVLAQYNAGTPITIVYPLATPIEYAISEAELAQYSALRTNLGFNSIYTNSIANLEVTYYASDSCVPVIYNESYAGKVLTIDENGVVIPKQAASGGVGQKTEPGQYGAGGEIFNDYEYNTAGDYAHAEGMMTQASGLGSHAEGEATQASGYDSHAEGFGTIASGEVSHAEGSESKSIGSYSHAEGYWSLAEGYASHAEGEFASASGYASHAETYGYAKADGSHAESSGEAHGAFSHAEGYGATSYGDYSHAEGVGETTEFKITGAANATTYSGTNAPSVGMVVRYGNIFAKVIESDFSAKTFTVDKTLSTQEITEGWATMINGIAYGEASHVEGMNNKATGNYSHAEGFYTIASSTYAHAEGSFNQATGSSSHAEGQNTKAIGSSAHAEGNMTNAHGASSHSEGQGTTAKGRSQHVQGEWNISEEITNQNNRGTYAHILGNGTVGAPSNAHTVDWSGNAWYAGIVKVGGTSYNDAKELATKEYVESVASGGSKGNGIFYIEGFQGSYSEDWKGTHEDITEYYPGLVVAYKTPTDGGIVGDIVRLNINDLGWTDIVINKNTYIITDYPAGTILLLVYTIDDGTGYWKIYDNNTDTKNTAGTAPLSSQKLYLVGAQIQASPNSTRGYATNTNNKVYIGTDNCLYSNGSKVVTSITATDASNNGNITISFS